MLKKIIIIFILCVFYVNVFSQDGQVRGTILNSIGTRVSGASIYLISENDTLFTKTHENGSFLFKGMPGGKYCLVVNALGYKRITYRFEFEKSLNLVEVPPFHLTDSLITLKEVVIRTRIPVVFKKDTVEYDSGSYRVRQGAMVIDLLKLMPGLIVQANGELTYQGIPINTVKVNGKDFFSGDVATYIQQLPAEITSKIQIVDDYGTDASFTGVKKNNPTKILNIKFKDTIKVGVFGNVTSSISNNKQSRISQGANYWAGEKQISESVAVNSSNGLSGISSDKIGAVTYRDIWGNKILSSFSYDVANSEMKSENFTNQITVAPEGVIYRKDLNTIHDRTKRHVLSTNFSFTPNSNTYLTLNSHLNINSLKNFKELNSSQRGLIFNDLSSRVGAEVQSPNFSSSLYYVHNFKKQYRNFSTKIDLTLGTVRSLANSSNYVGESVIAENPTLETIIRNVISTTNIGVGVNYVEPFNSNMFLDLNYTTYRMTERNSFSTEAFSQDLMDSSGVRVNALNTNLKLQNDLVLTYRYSNDKLRINIGSFFKWIKLNNGSYEDTPEFYFAPIFGFNYDFNNKNKINVEYSTNSTLPNYYQLRPVPDIQDVRNTIIGNPNLKASVDHSLTVNYTHAISSSTLLRLYGTSSFSINQIVMDSFLKKDSLGNLMQTTTYRNINGGRRFNFGYNFSTPFAAFDDYQINLVLAGAFNNNRNISFFNSLKNVNRNQSYDQRIYTQFFSKNITLSAAFNYNYSKNNFNLGGAVIKKIEQKKVEFDWVWNMNNTLILSTQVNKSLNEGYADGVNSNPLILNFSANYKLLRSKPISIGIHVTDLLNQGNTFSQFVDGNEIVDIKNSFVTRSFVISCLFQFNKFSGK